MAEYIEREALLKEIDEEIEFESPMYTTEQNEYLTKGLKIARKDIKRFPSADVVEVVHGCWKGIELKDTCSVCNRSISEICDADSYIEIEVLSELIACPFCGAKMDGDDNESL